MTEAEARAEIALLTDAETDPVLAPAELDLLLRRARRADSVGLWPADTGWEPTYDVNHAVAQGWLLKAGRLANRYLFMSGGKMLSRQQYYEHCMEMHKRFASKSMGSIRLGGFDPLLHGAVPNNT